MSPGLTQRLLQSRDAPFFLFDPLCTLLNFRYCICILDEFCFRFEKFVTVLSKMSDNACKRCRSVLKKAGNHSLNFYLEMTNPSLWLCHYVTEHWLCYWVFCGVLVPSPPCSPTVVPPKKVVVLKKIGETW